MITIRTANYSNQELAIISKLCVSSVDTICKECGNLCVRFGGHFKCPYKWLIYDIDYVHKKYAQDFGDTK